MNSWTRAVRVLPVASGEADGLEGRRLGDLGEAFHSFALQRRAALLVCPAGRGQLVDRGVGAHPGGQVDVLWNPSPGSGGVGAVHRELDLAAGEVLDHDVDEPAAELWLGGPVGVLIVLGAKEPEEHRQADHPSACAGQRHYERDVHPAVTEAGAFARALGLRAVVQVVSAEHIAAAAPEEGVIDGQRDRRIGRQAAPRPAAP